MSKILSAVVALFISIPVFAQSTAATDKIQVKLGGVATSEVKDGKVQARTVPKAEILSNTVMTVPRKGCEVTSFQFSILPKGADLFGPFTATGNQLTPKMQQFIKENTGRIFIENIKVKCGSTEEEAMPMVIKFTE